MLITGAAGGIGRVALELFAREGATVVATDMSPAPADALPPATEYRPADLTADSEARALVDALVSDHGRLDALYCNHGITVAEPFLASTMPSVDRMIAVNLRSSYLINLHAAQAMAAGGGGAIVNVSSSAALKPMPTVVAYAMTKGAIIQMTRAMACELAGDGIRVNAICPGIIDTPMPRRAVETLPAAAQAQALAAMASSHPLGRLGRPEEIASMALYLCSDEAAFVTGAVIPVDGGISAS